MVTPPENTTERLNRELNRLRFRSVGFWGGWALLIGIAALWVLLIANKPRETRYVTGIAGGTMPTMSETGATIKTRVTVEGRQRDILLPSQLVYPAQGETVCLRAGEHRFTGHTSYVIVSRTLCEGLSATPEVD